VVTFGRRHRVVEAVVAAQRDRGSLGDLLADGHARRVQDGRIFDWDLDATGAADNHGEWDGGLVRGTSVCREPSSPVRASPRPAAADPVDASAPNGQSPVRAANAS
jgi:hypothetical protein